MTTYTFGEKKVIIENGIVTHSDTTLCQVGQKPNLSALKKCGWNKVKTAKITYSKNLQNGRNFYN